jgi:ribonuclease P protein component
MGTRIEVLKPRARGNNETYVPAEQPASQENPRVPGSDADPSRPRGDRRPSPKGPQAPDGLKTRGGQSFPRPSRIRKKRDFVHCQKLGKRFSGRWLLVTAVPSREESSRLGLSISRKVGDAVERNRLKRRLREAFRRGRDAGAIDFCVSARAGAASAQAAEVFREFTALREKAARALLA